jgi:hypothetical protein
VRSRKLGGKRSSWGLGSRGWKRAHSGGLLAPGGDVAAWNFHVGLLSFQCVGRVCLGEMIT